MRSRTEMRQREQRQRIRRRRWRLFLVVIVVASALIFELYPRPPALTPEQARIVAIATSQLGYRTDPPDSYCNRFSAYFDEGATDCGPGLRDEQWCADFAAWVWRRAGVAFTYGFYPGEINSASASFYEWGLAHRTWHRAGDGYVPRAGDVAIYGLDVATMTAQHVAIVTSYTRGARGPNVVNGDGSRTAFSIVEVGHDQWKADIHDDGGVLAGYVSPPPSPTRSNERR